MVVGKDAYGHDIYHPIHEYNNTLKDIYLGEFMESEIYEEMLKNSGRSSISFTIFREGALKCKCIQPPTMRVCVDEIETAFSELVYCLKEIRRRSRGKCTCQFCLDETVKEESQGEGEQLVL